MKLCLTTGAVIAALVFSNVLSAQAVERMPAPPRATAAINDVLETLHQAGEFTGCILVAREGSVLYRKAFAASRREGDELLTKPRNIASLAKAFTAMAVMMLKEGERRHHDPPITLPHVRHSRRGRSRHRP
jgi:CubicO group peptidase (beta-lactamase class C family)